MTTVQVIRLPMLLLLCVLQARLSSSACVEVDSDTEAVVGKDFRLGCISCKMRGEVEATATVDWWFRAVGEHEFTHIYSYSNKVGMVTDERFMGRIKWLGSKNTLDLQDGTLNILNVTYNDTGSYRCYFYRTLTFTYYEYYSNTSKLITIDVLAKATRSMASILSEVMMYVSIIGLQLWLLVEMVYCYRKIAAAGEEALRENEAEYLAITSESKDKCTGVAVAEARKSHLFTITVATTFTCSPSSRRQPSPAHHHRSDNLHLSAITTATTFTCSRSPRRQPSPAHHHRGDNLHMSAITTATTFTCSPSPRRQLSPVHNHHGDDLHLFTITVATTFTCSRSPWQRPSPVHHHCGDNLHLFTITVATTFTYSPSPWRRPSTLKL